jgi:GNAT superfamily N-acetyltransferase
VPAIAIRQAETEADFKAAQRLCHEWLDWHWQAFPEDGPRQDNPLDPVKYQDIIDNLQHLHARPRGAILLAEVDGRAVGCVMYHELEPGTAEVKRLFVNQDGRGFGLGRLLLERMFTAMNSDGYRTVMFSSARFLTHARQLYESVGFRDMPHPDGFPEGLRGFVYFMQRPLV